MDNSFKLIVIKSKSCVTRHLVKAGQKGMNLNTCLLTAERMDEDNFLKLNFYAKVLAVHF